MLPAGRLRGHSVFPAMAPPMPDIDHGVMPHFLVEIDMSDAGEAELERAVRMLQAAQGRLREGADQSPGHRRDQPGGRPAHLPHRIDDADGRQANPRGRSATARPDPGDQPDRRHGRASNSRPTRRC